MMRINEIKTILWDWNGTLLDDISHCIQCMNILLEKRKLELLCKERYLEVFTFPVKDYYTQLGFDFEREQFEIPAEEFIVHYNAGLHAVPLFEDVTPTLKFFDEQNIQQYIVSAMQNQALKQSVKDRNIHFRFRLVSGIEDNLAYGKTDIAHKLLEQENIETKHALLIGDTLHDAEVAKETGVACVLISRGHQHHQRLVSSGNRVFTSLGALVQGLT